MPSEINIAISRVPGTEDIPLPAYQTEGAAGMDLHAAIDAPIIIEPGERTAVPAGIFIAVPPGYEAQVRGRSGLARNKGVSLANGVGTIDSDFRGHVHVLLINHGDAPCRIERGERIAQLVVAPVMRVLWQEKESLDETGRGAGGFGHTGSGSG